MEEFITLDNMRKAAALMVVALAAAVPLCRTIKYFWQQAYTPRSKKDKRAVPDKTQNHKTGQLRLLRKTP